MGMFLKHNKGILKKKNIIIALEVFVSSSDVSCHSANSQVGRSFQGSSPLMMNFDLSRLALRWAKEAKDAVKELRWWWFYLPTRFCNWWSLGEVWIVAFCWISWLKVFCFHVVLHLSILYSRPRCFFLHVQPSTESRYQPLRCGDAPNLCVYNHLASNLTGVPKS